MKRARFLTLLALIFLPTAVYPKTMTGLDVIIADGFTPFAGKNIGLITNHTGLDGQGRADTEIFSTQSDIHLTAIFTP